MHEDRVQATSPEFRGVRGLHVRLNIVALSEGRKDADIHGTYSPTLRHQVFYRRQVASHVWQIIVRIRQRGFIIQHIELPMVIQGLSNGCPCLNIKGMVATQIAEIAKHIPSRAAILEREKLSFGRRPSKVPRSSDGFCCK